MQQCRGPAFTEAELERRPLPFRLRDAAARLMLPVPLIALLRTVGAAFSDRGEASHARTWLAQTTPASHVVDHDQDHQLEPPASGRRLVRRHRPADPSGAPRPAAVAGGDQGYGRPAGEGGRAIPAHSDAGTRAWLGDVDPGAACRGAGRVAAAVRGDVRSRVPDHRPGRVRCRERASLAWPGAEPPAASLDRQGSAPSSGRRGRRLQSRWPDFLPGFRDVGPREPTHFAADVVPLRIDRCLLRGVACLEARALLRDASDHRPIVVRLDVATRQQSAAA